MIKLTSLKVTVIISMLYSSAMVFYSTMPSLFVVGLGFLHLVFLLQRLRRFFDVKETIFLSTILLVPTSTISIIGHNSALFPLSWFHVLVLFLFFWLYLSERMNKTFFLLLLCSVFYLFILAFLERSILEAMKQVLMMLLFLMSFPIGVSLSRKPSANLLSVSADFFVLSTIAFGTQVILQRAFIKSSGIVIGHFVITGQGRFAYAGLMGDYSFATVYLAAGCMVVLIQFMEWERIRLFRFIAEEVFLLTSMLVVTARTGWAALALTLLVYFLRNIRRINWKTVLLVMFGIVAVPVVFNELIISRVGQNLLDASGRFENYQKAWKIIQEHPLFGVGLGSANLYNDYGISLPHNFFIQYQLQIGFAGICIILAFFIVFLRKHYVKKNAIKWVFWLVVFSSMFIPDIFSSRFYYVIIIVCMLPVYRKDENVWGKSG